MAKRGSKLARKAKKKGVARSKMANIQNTKRIKNKEFTPAERKARTEERREKKKVIYSDIKAKKLKEFRSRLQTQNDEEVYPLSAEVTGEEMLTMIDQEDLSYLIDHSKNVQMEQEKKETAGEKPYEREERSFHPMGNDMKTLLPYKTKTGLIGRYTTREVELSKIEVEKPEGPTADDDDDAAEVPKKEVPVEKSVVELMAERHLTLERKKVSIGCLAVNFLESPQDRLHCLSNLVHMLEEKDRSVCYSVRKYASISLLEVFHKTLPAYHIEPHDLTQKLKKETKEQYLYENFILKSYQTYLKELERFLKEAANNRKNNPPLKHLEMVALTCMGELLIKHNHFTYTNNIIAAMVPYLNNKDDKVCHLILSYFNMLFNDDVKGDVSLEAVKRMDHYIRKRSYHVRVECLRVFLSLRIKNVKSLDDELEAKNTAKKKLTHTEKLMRKLTEESKPKKSNKEAKRYRKFRKLEEQKKEHEIKKTEEVRSSQHTQIIEILFGLYFHILKRRPNNNLNGIVLEGLAKFSHLVNVEFFSDLLNVLGGLMDEGILKFRESLHCIQTVFTILSDQGEVLTIDPQRFYSYLYGNLFQLSGGDSQADTKSAMSSIMQMLVMRRKRVSVARVTAFTKRLVTLSLTLMHNGAISSLATARYIVLAHPSSEALLEQDSEGSSGLFLPEVEEPEHCNAASSTLWELHLLNHHYHSTVKQFAHHLAIRAPLQGDGQLPGNIGKRKVEDLYDDFDSSTMRFNPTIPSPSQYLTKKMWSDARSSAKRLKIGQLNTQYMNRQIESVLKTDNFLGDASPLPQKINAKKKNGLKKNMTISNGNNVNYFSGVLPNMKLKKFKASVLPEFEDVILSLVNVDSKV